MNKDSTADRNERMIDEDSTVEHKVPKLKFGFDFDRSALMMDVVNEKYATKDMVSKGIGELNKKLDSLIMMRLYEDGSFIRFIENPTEEMRMISVEDDGLNLRYVNDQTFSICLAACEQDGMALEFVNPGMQTYKNCEAAIRSSRGSAIRFVNTESPWYEDLSYESVKYSGENLKYIKNPSERVIVESIKHQSHPIIYHIDSIFESFSLMMKLVSENPHVIKHIPLDILDRNNVCDLCKLALRIDASVIEDIQAKELTEEICLTFLEEYNTCRYLNRPSINYIPEAHQTETVCLKALSFDDNNIEWIFDSGMTKTIIEYFIKHSSHSSWWSMKKYINKHVWRSGNIKLKFMYVLKCLGFYRKKKRK